MRGFAWCDRDASRACGNCHRGDAPRSLSNRCRQPAKPFGAHACGAGDGCLRRQAQACRRQSDRAHRGEPHGRRKGCEEHCALCHGGAKAKISTMQNQFSPPAPQLINRIPHDPPSWMFWVTKHGVRMTGMPAWTGILSDDEIWKIVAFIKNSGTLPPETQAAWQALAANR